MICDQVIVNRALFIILVKQVFGCSDSMHKIQVKIHLHSSSWGENQMAKKVVHDRTFCQFSCCGGWLDVFLGCSHHLTHPFTQKCKEKRGRIFYTSIQSVVSGRRDARNLRRSMKEKQWIFWKNSSSPVSMKRFLELHSIAFPLEKALLVGGETQ